MMYVKILRNAVEKRTYLLEKDYRDVAVIYILNLLLSDHTSGMGRLKLGSPRYGSPKKNSPYKNYSHGHNRREAR